MKRYVGSYSKITIYFIIIFCSGIGYFSTTKNLFAKPNAVNYAREILVNQNGSIKRALFPPDDNAKKALIGLINAETQHIYLAIYMFTDRDIAKALIDAYKRGVKIEVIADRSCAQSIWNKLRILAQSGIPIYIWPQALEETSAIMHNKFIVFASAIDNKTILWTGSYNFSKAASLANQENILVLDDLDLAKNYINQFKKLKKLSERVGLEKFDDAHASLACGEEALCDPQPSLVY